MSIIIKGITKDKFATLMIGEDVIKRYPDVIDGCDYFYGHEVWDIPPHGRLIDADALIKAWEGEKESYREIVESLMEEAPTIIEAEE